MDARLGWVRGMRLRACAGRGCGGWGIGTEPSRGSRWPSAVVGTGRAAAVGGGTGRALGAGAGAAAGAAAAGEPAASAPAGALREGVSPVARKAQPQGPSWSRARHREAGHRRRGTIRTGAGPDR